MKKVWVYFLLVVLLGSFACAGAIEITSDRLTDRTPAGGECKFNIAVKNNQLRYDVIRLSADDLSIYPFSDVAEYIRAVPASVELNGHGSTEVEVSVKTMDGLRPNKNYVVYMWAKSQIDPRIKTKFPLTLYVVSPQELIDVLAEIPEEIFPGSGVSFDVTFKNNANEKLENLDVYITSSIFSEEDKINLYPLKDLNKEYRFSIPSGLEAGEYSFSIRVYHEGVLKGFYSTEFNVALSSDVNEKSSTSKGFLSSVVVLSKTNEGNTAVEKAVSYPCNWFKRIFTSINPGAEVVVENGKKFYQWKFVLQPGEEYKITINTDYKILFVIVLIILGLVALRIYYKYRNLSIEKKIFKISDSKESISDLKILLHIKNNTNKDIHHIKVIDLLPNFIKPSSDFGTLKPTSIQKGSAGMRLVWEINSLEPGEERIISYKVHSKIHVVGKIDLPCASVQYRTTGKKLINIKSNKLSFVARRD